MQKIVAREFKFWAIALSIIIVIGGAAALLLSPILNVKKIQVQRHDARLDIEAIQQALAPLFDSRLFLVSKAKVNELLKDFPDITDTEIDKDYPSLLTVSLTLDPLVAKLEIDEPETGTGSTPSTSSGMSIYITSKGYAVFSAVSLSNNVLPTLEIRDWGIKPTHHSQLVDEEFLLMLFKARDTLTQEFGMPINRAIIFVRAQEFHLSGSRLSFWFDVASPLEEQFDRFRSFLSIQPLDGVTQYVDLRLSDRVVYK